MRQVFEDNNTKKCVITIILSWVLIILVGTFWGPTNGAAGYALFALIIPTSMLIKIRWAEEDNKK